MIKRSLLWVLAAYCIGILFRDRQGFVILPVAIFYGIVIFLQTKKPFRRFLADGNRCLLCLPAAFLLGALLAANQASAYPVDAVLQESRTAVAEGTVVSVQESGTGKRIILKDITLRLTGEKNELLTEKNSMDDSVTGQQDGITNESIIKYHKGKLLVWADNCDVAVGNRIQVSGNAAAFSIPENPGQFDERAYYRADWYCCKLFADYIQVVEPSIHPIREGCRKIRQQLREAYQSVLPEKHAGIVNAILLGERAGLSKDIKDLYRENGISHILSISGLHISLLGMGLFSLLRRCKSPLIPAAAITVLVLLLYGCMTEFGVSTKRAIGMLILAMAAKLLGKSYDSRSACGFCALVILLISPMQLFQTGFQLSFAASFGISACSAELRRMRLDGEKGILQKLRYACLSGISVQLITLPLILYAFYEVPVYSFLINLLIVPLLSLLVGLSILTGITACISITLGSFFAGGSYYILELYEFLCRKASMLPSPVIVYGKPEIFQMILYYGIVFAFFSLAGYLARKSSGGGEIHRIRRRAALILLLLPIALFRFPDKSLHINFLSVGQGDCCVLRSESGNAYLVDCGSLDVSGVGTYRLQPFLKHEGIRELEAVLLSHADADHTNGVKELLIQQASNPNGGGIKVKCLVLPAGSRHVDTGFDEMIALAEQANIPIRLFSAGDYISDGELQLRCIFPNVGQITSDRNDSSMILHVKQDRFDCLLAADTAAAGEKAVLQSLGTNGKSDVDIEVLKVAHHGSRNSSSQSFLYEIKPFISVISCGRGNRYGHPHEETLERLSDCGSNIYITAHHGAIRMKIKNDKILLL